MFVQAKISVTMQEAKSEDIPSSMFGLVVGSSHLSLTIPMQDLPSALALRSRASVARNTEDHNEHFRISGHKYVTNIKL